MEKTMRIGTIATVSGRRASIYIKAKITEGNLSISGTVGPLPSGNCLGGCGQIDMEFAHHNPIDNDKRTTNPIKPNDITFAPGWTAKLWLDLLDVWHRWHLNDMQPACAHQRTLGWTYEDHHNPKTFEGEACPTCGYKIGSRWLKEELPQTVIDFIAALPDTDKQPAWV